MNQENEKIPSPFEPPEGYFDSFGSRLMDSIRAKENKTAQMRVLYRRRIRNRVIAAAASVLILAVGGWFLADFFKPQPPVVVKKVQPKIELPVVNEPAIPDTMQIKKTETAVLEAVLDEAENPVVQVASPAIPLTESALAQELEDAGLIVIETTDGLFDEMEIAP